MAEKKVTKSAKNDTKEKTTKKVASKTSSSKKPVKSTSKKEVKKVNVKEVKNDAKNVSKKENTIKEQVKEEKVLDVKAPEKKEKKNKKNKFLTWFNKLTLEQITVAGFIIVMILLIVLIVVATKNTKTTNGKDIVAKINGKTITADDLYKELKAANGRSVTINLIDDYILNKEYKTTDEMKNSAKTTIQNYKNTYSTNYKSFLEYNGIKDDAELKELLIKNSKLTKAVEQYIKDNLTEKEMKDYYESDIVGDIRASHILVSFNYDDDDTDEQKEEKKNKALEKAKELIEKIKNGEDFKTLAKENSDDSGSKENGGDLGYFNKGQMVEEFEKAAYALDVNAYTTEPVETTYGYHIIMKTGEKKKASFKKAKDTIIEKLVSSKKDSDSTLSAKALIALRKKYKLTIKDKTIKKDYNSYIKEAVTTTTTTASSSN